MFVRKTGIEILPAAFTDHHAVALRIRIPNHLVNYRLQAQRRLSLKDYLDFIRRARWKEYHHTPRRQMVGRYLDVL
jgi:hypothetical protein